MFMVKNNKVQFNVRVDEPLVHATQQVAARLRFSHQEITETALMCLFGSRDGLVREKKKKIQQAIKDLQLELPFSAPEPQAAGFAA